MKKTGICPKCGEGGLFHAPEVMDRGDGNAAMPLSIGRTDSIEARDLGRFEVYACRGCGRAEFYVVNPAELP